MAEELEKTEETTELEIKTADDLKRIIIDLQGQIANMQETIDKLSPVEEETAEEVTEETEVEEEVSDEELSEIDRLLQDV